MLSRMQLLAKCRAIPRRSWNEFNHPLNARQRDGGRCRTGPGKGRPVGNATALGCVAPWASRGSGLLGDRGNNATECDPNERCVQSLGSRGLHADTYQSLRYGIEILLPPPREAW